MTHKAKASSAGSTEAGGSRGLLRRALATRGSFGRRRGSGAPTSRRWGVAFVSALVLAITVSLGAAAAIADSPPAVTIDGSPTAEYTTAQVSGTVNPSGGPSSTNWHFEYTTTPDDESSWQFGPGGEIAGPDAEGTSPVPVNGTIEGLQPETGYSVRLVAENGEGANHVVTEAPYPTFTTKGPIGKPAVVFDPITVFTDKTAHLTGSINPNAPSNDPGFNVHYEFICEPSCALFGLFNPGGDVAADNSSHPFEVNLSGLEPNTDYEVELIAHNAGGSETATRNFHTDAAAPSIETIPAFAFQGGTKALLGARVNPKNTATTYWIEYGPTAAYGNSVPVGEDASAGSGGKAQIFTQALDGLTPSTEYHFRAVAKSTEGEVHGKDMNFETLPAGPVSESCPNETLRRENNSTALPDCRAYEQVSPVDKNGYDAPAQIDGPSIGSSPAFDVTPVIGSPQYYAAEDGSALAFESFGGFGDARTASFFNHYLSKRTSLGWETEGLDPPQQPTQGISTGPRVNVYEPKDMGYAIIQNPRNGHLAPGDRPDEPNLYLRDNLTGEYHTLDLKEPVGTPGSDPNTRPYVFSSTRALVPEVEENGSLYTYEWDDGHVALASIEPDGDPFPAGAYLQDWAEANGTRSIVMKDNAGTGQLYLRTIDSSGAHTVEISASQRSAPDPEGPTTTNFFQLSKDGSKILFIAREALTDDAPIGGYPAIYEYDVATHQLTDVTGGSIGTQLLVGAIGMSQDGSYVYFRSIGKYHPGENDAEEAAYIVWHNGTSTQIGPPHMGLGAAEVEDRPEATGDRLSPDGRFFTFTTRSQVTAYDNTDQTAETESGEPRRDTEVYVYDAVKDRLTCVSCNPTGARPVGQSSAQSRPQAATPIQPFVLNDGTTFFNSADALVPEDVNSQQDVYEWEGGRVHLISSGVGPFATYGSASADGKDVYIATRAQLVPSDRDELADIYDARVDGGFPQPTTPNLCESLEGCHGPASSAPPFADPASGSFSSGLKSQSPAAQRLRKALKTCKHKKTKKAKARCKKAAKKRYAKASKGRAH